MTTLLVSHPSFLEHDTGPYHPERPDRLRAILAALEDPAFDGLVRLAAPAASMEELTRVHPQDYVEAILGIRPGGRRACPCRRRHRDEPGQRRGGAARRRARWWPASRR